MWPYFCVKDFFKDGYINFIVYQNEQMNIYNPFSYSFGLILNEVLSFLQIHSFRY